MANARMQVKDCSQQTHMEFARDVAKMLYEREYNHADYLPKLDTWRCRCSRDHSMHAKHCSTCKQPCPSLSEPTAQNTASGMHFIAWTCACTQVYPRTVHHCSVCHEKNPYLPKPVSILPPQIHGVVVPKITGAMDMSPTQPSFESYESTLVPPLVEDKRSKEKATKDEQEIQKLTNFWNRVFTTNQDIPYEALCRVEQFLTDQHWTPADIHQFRSRSRMVIRGREWRLHNEPVFLQNLDGLLHAYAAVRHVSRIDAAPLPMV